MVLLWKILVHLLKWILFIISLYIFLKATKLADPAFCISTIWPIMYSISPTSGSQLLWVICFSEWLNVMSKWALMGNRPYWWAPKNLNINLNQFAPTCETGPGNPSGHCWLIAATLTFLLFKLNKNYRNIWLSRISALFATIVFMIIAVSRNKWRNTQKLKSRRNF